MGARIFGENAADEVNVGKADLINKKGGGGGGGVHGISS